MRGKKNKNYGTWIISSQQFLMCQFTFKYLKDNQEWSVGLHNQWVVCNKHEYMEVQLICLKENQERCADDTITEWFVINIQSISGM